MPTWIVTGGAGFIGSNFVRHALGATEVELVVVDKLTYAGNPMSLDEVAEDPRFRLLEADIADRAAMRELFARTRPEAVLNFAAESHVDRSIDDPGIFLHTNIRGTFELLEASRALCDDDGGPSDFRFLQVSTDEVYGTLGATGRFSETTPYAPNSPYAASKAAADHLVRAYGETYDLPVLITNCSNNYGPRQFPEKLVPLMILNALEGKDLPLYGDGGNVRDWLYVGDHCAGILEVLRHGRPGEKYNMGGDSERTNLEIVDTLCDLLEELRPAADNPALTGRGAATYSELKRFVADRPGHDRRYAVDPGKIRRELGWQPRHDLESGLRETVSWYLDNLEWCEAVQSGRYRRERLGLSAGRKDQESS